MTILILYAVCMTVAVAGSLTTAAAYRDGPLCRCALVLLVNWAAGMMVGYGGWTDAWQANIPIDALTAYVILRHPAGRWQAALGVTYCIQILMHLGYAGVVTFDKGADAMAYYNQLTGVAFLQLALLGGWSIGIWGTRNRWVDRRAPSALPRATRVAEAG